MLNRRHIRLKVMQVLYMHQQNNAEPDAEQLIREYEKNVNRMNQLYLYMLDWLRELHHYALRYDDEIRDRHLASSRSYRNHLKLAENQYIKTLAEDEALGKTIQKELASWNHEADDSLIRKCFLDIKNSEAFEEYVSLDNHPEADFDFVIYLFRHYSEEFQSLEQHLEEEFPNFQDDKRLVYSMFKKTMQNIKQEKSPYIVEFVQDYENTIGFGKDLIRAVLKNLAELKEIIASKITKWEPGQIAVTDNILLRMGIAEFKYFPSIPSTVTINEYVELAKSYSPPKSKKFINGLLDSVSRELVP